ncbi:MAG: protein jag [Firmicutes bacterium]|jgi:spoIIIJ-associated protein|nr:protein jag [Bacillota bacterium]
MNLKIEVTDKTVEGAIEKGLEELGIKRDNAQIEILSEPGTGFLGGLLGNKLAKISIAAKMEPQEYAEDVVSTVLSSMGLKGQVHVEQTEENIWIDVSGEKMGILIGRRGQTLNSLQYLVNIIVRRQYENFSGRVIVDAENYREERERSLIQLAQNVAYRAEKQHQAITLEPMNPQERRIIHISLKENPNINTYSTGEEPYRRVVISPAE